MGYSYLADGCDSCETVGSNSPFTNLSLQEVAQQAQQQGVPQLSQQQVQQQTGRQQVAVPQVVQQQAVPQQQQVVPQQQQQQQQQQAVPQVEQQGNLLTQGVEATGNVILGGLDVVASPLVQQEQQILQQQGSPQQKQKHLVKGLNFKTDNVMIVLGLVTIAALAVNTTIKHYIEKSIKFNDGSSRYFIVYAVVSCLIPIIVYNLLEKK